jgi:hypothetical protein
MQNKVHFQEAGQGHEEIVALAVQAYVIKNIVA